MIRTFRYPLEATAAQSNTLESWRVACQQLYNAALEERRDAWRKQRVSVSRNDQCKELTALRAADAKWAAIPVWVARSAIFRVDHAFRGFFRRCKHGGAPGFPRFRSADRYNGIDFGSWVPRVDGDRLNVPKLGMVKFHKYREMRGTVKLVRIGRSARGWYVSFVCDVGPVPEKVAARSSVGIDVGLEAFATLSNGERVENQRFRREAQDSLARRQRSLSRKKRGSMSRGKAKLLVARAQERIRNQRLDFARKLACCLFRRFDMVVHEQLKIAPMMRGNMAKSINDVAWGQFLRALACKAESAGKWCVAVDPSYTSQTCPLCGTVAKKTLSEREHRCDCGFVAHRDHAAALNVLARGLRVGQLTEGWRV